MNAGHVEPALNFLIGVSDEGRREGRSRKGRETKNDYDKSCFIASSLTRIPARVDAEKWEEKTMRKERYFSSFLYYEERDGKKVASFYFSS